MFEHFELKDKIMVNIKKKKEKSYKNKVFIFKR